MTIAKQKIRSFLALMLVIGAFFSVGVTSAYAASNDLTIEEAWLDGDTLYVYVTEEKSAQIFELSASDYAKPGEEFISIQATDRKGQMSNVVKLYNPYFVADTLLSVAEQYLGYPYVWGGASPETSFDCSGLVCWAINESGIGSIERTTAQGLYNLCEPVSADEVRPGDLVFFHSTYRTTDTVTHVGIYSGDEMMLHAGDPVGYVNYVSRYGNLFYAYGRIPR